MRRASFFARALLVCMLALVGGVGCQLYENSAPIPYAGPLLPGQTAEVFTTAHPTFGAAVNSFFDRRPTPVQPIDFPHVIHVENEIGCTQICHDGVTSGPVAGIPGVTTCLICHIAIATDRPVIQQITAMHEQGLDLAWQRVFGYQEQAHVRFNHAPHIRAEVECATCHGNIAEQTVAQRNVELTMGTCVNCHNERNASVDCLTCHF